MLFQEIVPILLTPPFVGKKRRENDAPASLGDHDLVQEKALRLLTFFVTHFLTLADYNESNSDNVFHEIKQKKVSGEQSFPFPLETPSQGRAILTNCLENERISAKCDGFVKMTSTNVMAE